MALPLVLWLASMHTLNFQKRRILVSAEAESNDEKVDAARDSNSETGAQIWALHGLHQEHSNLSLHAVDFSWREAATEILAASHWQNFAR